MELTNANTAGHIVVLASGSGSNLQTLLDVSSDEWAVVGVVSDRPGSGALERAARANVPTRTVRWRDYPDREAFTEGICARIAEFDPGLIVLAGFMRVLGPAAVRRWPNRIVNVHPSLLPAFPGAHAVRDALDHGVKVTGVTIHFVDEQLDHGPIIRQEAVDVLPDDNEDSLHRRIQTVEHRLLPEVVASLVGGEYDVSGRIVKGRVTA